MRKQYHSLANENRLFTWDVHRLIELAKGLPVKQIALRAIAELDEPFWFAQPALPSCRVVALHAKLIADADLNFPIIVSSTGRVMDGMHRVCKALLAGCEFISAVRFEQDPEPDYIDANLDQLPYD